VRDSLRVREEFCLPPRYYPSAFSPNGDGTNDRWQVFGDPDLEWLGLEVFDRWGGMVWRSGGAPVWNGRDVAGRPVPPGLYLARVRFRLPNTEAEFSERIAVQVLR
jgi:gliding motility-associated-like protein